MTENDRLKAKKSEGAWIFLSHSHEDWRTVREIRNILEGKGHKPLMFFLKCLNDHSELHELIKREIEARRWFLLCDSENARKSRWVQDEIALIKSMPDKYSEQVDLDQPIEHQLDRIDALCRRATVYLSYARDDTAGYAAQLLDQLHLNGYYLREPDFLGIPGQNWQEEITRSIDDAILHGFVLILLSPNSAKKEFVRFEVEYAVTKSALINRGGSVVPVVFGDPRATIGNFSPRARQLLESTSWFHFSGVDFKKNAARLMRELKERVIDDPV